MGLVRALPPLPRSRPAWAEAAPTVPDVRWSPARPASLPHLRAQPRFGLGRRDEALVSTGKRVAAYHRPAPTRRERALVRVSLVRARVLGELEERAEELSTRRERAGDRAQRRRPPACRNPSLHEPELARVPAYLSLCRQSDGDFDGAVTVARESVALTRRLAESD
ncbi:hypothetical protein OG585_03285 [Streptomyces sp. NBC_01340]|uniref:hypothetical protein n=1 Tax=unclassified Streptomyces TaxID=2593676 RepID=UPI0022512EC8|nr:MULTISPECIES: hypothetical protein [unclassified Streptomyces]MCX4462156.1 hypothetical protein [Streptomyces sp. NBC_01719]MCX4491064.1 hypothetical protein [Streptomyces sp. NBC_01728]MCX4594344.1 hypothetical protein [Streptomyces sp. NBC_01549]WSI36391.1 hypothetical protein OG585_03285 [Streptomyces sp. NBC_01340]